MVRKYDDLVLKIYPLMSMSAICFMLFQCCRGQQKHILRSLLARHETLIGPLATHFPAIQHDLVVIGPLADRSQIWTFEQLSMIER